MSFTRIEVTVQPTVKTFQISATSQTALSGDGRPVFNYGEQSILCLNFVNPDGTVYPLEAGDEFTLSIDSTRRNVTDTADLMAYSDNDEVDIAGDWADISRANGKISIRVNCQRDLFSSRITETDGSQECYLQVNLTPSGESNHCTMVQDLVNCDGTVIEYA